MNYKITKVIGKKSVGCIITIQFKEEQLTEKLIGREIKVYGGLNTEVIKVNGFDKHIIKPNKGIELVVKSKK